MMKLNKQLVLLALMLVIAIAAALVSFRLPDEAATESGQESMIVEINSSEVQAVVYQYSIRHSCRRRGQRHICPG